MKLGICLKRNYHKILNGNKHKSHGIEGVGAQGPRGCLLGKAPYLKLLYAHKFGSTQCQAHETYTICNRGFGHDDAHRIAQTPFIKSLSPKAIKEAGMHDHLVDEALPRRLKKMDKLYTQDCFGFQVLKVAVITMVE